MARLSFQNVRYVLVLMSMQLMEVTLKNCLVDNRIISIFSNNCNLKPLKWLNPVYASIMLQ